MQPSSLSLITDPVTDMSSSSSSASSKQKKTVEEKLEKNFNYAFHQKDAPLREISLDSVFLHAVPFQKKCHSFLDLKVGIAETKGLQTKQENTTLTTLISFYQGQTERVSPLLGILDGHNGIEAAHFVQNNLASFLSEELRVSNPEETTVEGVYGGIIHSFTSIQEAMKNTPSCAKSGTTACISLLFDQTVWVANLGDARAILIADENKIVPLSHDGTTSEPRFQKKIKKMGGRLILDAEKTPRIEGRLSCAGALGDFLVKNERGEHVVPHTPQITRYSFELFQKAWLIIACDGVWSVSTIDEVASLAFEGIGRKKNLEEIARNIGFNALQKGSQDNISVMITEIK